MSTHFAAKNVSSVADSIVALTKPDESPSPSHSSSSTRRKSSNDKSISKKRFVNPYVKKRPSTGDVEIIPEGGATDASGAPLNSNNSSQSDLLKKQSVIYTETDNIDFNSLAAPGAGSEHIDLSHIDLDNLDNINLDDLNINLSQFASNPITDPSNPNNANNDNTDNNNNHSKQDSLLQSAWDHPEMLKNLKEIEKQHEIEFEKQVKMQQELQKQNSGPSAAPAAAGMPAIAEAPAPPAAGGAGAARTSLVGVETKNISTLPNEQQTILQEKQLVSTFAGLKSISSMTPNELEQHKSEILERKLVSSAQYLKLMENAQIQEKIRNINASNVSNDANNLSEEDKQRIRDLKQQYVANAPSSGVDFANTAAGSVDNFIRPEQYDLTADIAHSKEEELRMRQLQQQELNSAAKVSSFQGLQSQASKKGLDDEHKEMAASQAKVTKFTGLQSGGRNIVTVDEKEKDELMKSKLVSQAKDNYNKSLGDGGKTKSKISVDTSVGAAAAAGKNIWKQREQALSPRANNAGPGASPTNRKGKRKKNNFIQ